MDDWLYPLLRFAHYGLLLGLFGITAFHHIGLRETLASQSMRKDNGALAIAALAAPALTIALMLLAISAMMAQPVWQLGHRLIMSQPDPDCCELDRGEIIIVSLIVSRGNCSEVLDFIKEALDEVALLIEEVTKCRFDHALRHGSDIGPGTARLHFGARRWRCQARVRAGSELCRQPQAVWQGHHRLPARRRQDCDERG